MENSKTRFEMTKKHHKETFLAAKKDGKMDLDFLPICEYIIKTKSFFTSSCCAGRIVLVSLNELESKKESAFYRKWHRTVKDSEILEGIANFNGEVLWFKQEPLIFHIGTDTLQNAKKILVAAEKVGVKRVGIKVAKEGKFIIEMIGTHNMSLPVKENGETKITNEYVSYLVKKANAKFKINQETIKKLYKEFKKDLK